MGELAILALAISTISITITRGGVFSKQRQWILERNTWLGKLFSCPYCLSHWVSALVVALYQPRPVILWLPLDLLLSVFMLVAIASVISGIIMLIFKFNDTDYEELYDVLDKARSKIKELKGS